MFREEIEELQTFGRPFRKTVGKLKFCIFESDAHIFVVPCRVVYTASFVS